MKQNSTTLLHGKLQKNLDSLVSKTERKTWLCLGNVELLSYITLVSLKGESHAARRVGNLAHLASVKYLDIIGGGVLGRY